MTNIAKILKYCPKGMKLYCTIYGEMKYDHVDNSDNIWIDSITDNRPYYVSKYGTLFTYEEFKNAECILFPSKDQRDWSKFRLPVKRGDIMMDANGECPFIATGEFAKDISPKYICGINSLGNFQLSYIEAGWTSIFCIPASEDMKEKLFKAIDENGYKWDGKNLIKKEHQFKPFDKVLVRDCSEELWKATLFSHYSGNENYPYETIKNMYSQCIPFEGNEHLVGTINSPE